MSNELKQKIVEQVKHISSYNDLSASTCFLIFFKSYYPYLVDEDKLMDKELSSHIKNWLLGKEFDLEIYIEKRLSNNDSNLVVHPMNRPFPQMDKIIKTLIRLGLGSYRDISLKRLSDLLDRIIRKFESGNIPEKGEHEQQKEFYEYLLDRISLSKSHFTLAMYYRAKRLPYILADLSDR